MAGIPEKIMNRHIGGIKTKQNSFYALKMSDHMSQLEFLRMFIHWGLNDDKKEKEKTDHQPQSKFSYDAVPQTQNLHQALFSNASHCIFLIKNSAARTEITIKVATLEKSEVFIWPI